MVRSSSYYSVLCLSILMDAQDGIDGFVTCSAFNLNMCYSLKLGSLDCLSRHGLVLRGWACVSHMLCMRKDEDTT